jgi:hypothetical protein
MSCHPGGFREDALASADPIVRTHKSCDVVYTGAKRERLPKSEEDRVAYVYVAPPDPNSAMFAKFQAEPDWMGSKMLTNVGGSMSEASVNSRAFHALNRHVNDR